MTDATVEFKQDWHNDFTSTTSTTLKSASRILHLGSTMAHLGLLNWANSIRQTMASDAGRQVFKDEVQTHGFLFLDDYLDNIVSGAKQEYVRLVYNMQLTQFICLSVH